jgi:hypothetical protein
MPSTSVTTTVTGASAYLPPGVGFPAAHLRAGQRLSLHFPAPGLNTTVVGALGPVHVVDNYGIKVRLRGNAALGNLHVADIAEQYTHSDGPRDCCYDAQFIGALEHGKLSILLLFGEAAHAAAGANGFPPGMHYGHIGGRWRINVSLHAIAVRWAIIAPYFAAGGPLDRAGPNRLRFRCRLLEDAGGGSPSAMVRVKIIYTADTPEQVMADVEDFLRLSRSLALYMVHGN